MATPVRFRVHERAVQQYTMPGGEVTDLIWDIQRGARDAAKVRAPKRTGKLSRNIRANRPVPTGLLRCAGLLYANVKYAMWVHDGTGTIFPKAGRYLTVPRVNQGGPLNLSGDTLRKSWLKDRGGGKKPYFLARSVSGQRAQPFLREALQVALAKESRLTYTRF